jgi:hypothetical protein
MLTCELTALGLIEVPPRPPFSRSFLISGRYKDCGEPFAHILSPPLISNPGWQLVLRPHSPQFAIASERCSRPSYTAMQPNPTNIARSSDPASFAPQLQFGRLGTVSLTVSEQHRGRRSTRRCAVEWPSYKERGICTA